MKHLALALALAISLTACEGGLFGAPPTPTPTPIPTSTPTPTPAPTATSTPPVAAGSPQAVSPQEAEATIRELFVAAEAGQWDRARALTSDQGQQVIDQLFDGLQRAAQGNVRPDLVVTRLEITRIEPQAQGTRVGARFAFDVRVRVGPLPVTIQSPSGEASFLVQRQQGRPVITRIEGEFR